MRSHQYMQRQNTTNKVREKLAKKLFDKNSKFTLAILENVSNHFSIEGIDKTKLAEPKTQEIILDSLNGLHTSIIFHQMDESQQKQLCQQLNVAMYAPDQLESCFVVAIRTLNAINQSIKEYASEKERVNIDAVAMQCILNVANCVVMLSHIHYKNEADENKLKQILLFIIEMMQFTKKHYRFVVDNNILSETEGLDECLLSCYDRLLPIFIKEETIESLDLAKKHLKDLKVLIVKPQYVMRQPMYYARQCDIALKENNFHKFKHYLYQCIASHEHIPNRQFIPLSNKHVNYLSELIPQFFANQQYKEALISAKMREECIALSLESYRRPNDIQENGRRLIVASSASKEACQEGLVEWEQEAARKELSVEFIKKSIAEKCLSDLFLLKDSYTSVIDNISILDNHHIKIDFKYKAFFELFIKHLRFGEIFFKTEEDALIIDPVLSCQPYAKMKAIFDRLTMVFGLAIQEPMNIKESEIKQSKLEQESDAQNNNNAQPPQKMMPNATPTKVISWNDQYPVYEEGNINCGVYRLYGIGEHYYVCINPDLLQEIYQHDQVLAEQLITICERGKVLGNSQGGKGFILGNHDLSQSGETNKTERNKRASKKNKKKSNENHKADKSKEKTVEKPKYVKVKDCTEDSRVYGKENVPKVTVTIDGKDESKKKTKDYHLLELNQWQKKHGGKLMFFAWPENIKREEITSKQIAIKKL